MVPIQPAPIGCVALILALIAAPLLVLGVQSSSTSIDVAPIYQDFGPAPVEEVIPADGAAAPTVALTPAPPDTLPSR
jgi:hypothetical protein